MSTENCRHITSYPFRLQDKQSDLTVPQLVQEQRPMTVGNDPRGEKEKERERKTGRRQIARANQEKRQRQATSERKGCGYTNARFILAKGWDDD